ncbi:hypothetical protein [Streptomyces anulatus]|uniref:hypothetical protein n=1 Tax=Streptomyces anulatus TaxID=1892 RepID=UPI0004C5CA8D|nr:hypothetical protein [Streptomyces anulatus]
MNQTTVGSTARNLGSASRFGRPAAPSVPLGSPEAVHAPATPQHTADLLTRCPAEPGFAAGTAALVSSGSGRALA